MAVCVGNRESVVHLVVVVDGQITGCTESGLLPRTCGKKKNSILGLQSDINTQEYPEKFARILLKQIYFPSAHN